MKPVQLILALAIFAVSGSTVHSADRQYQKPLVHETIKDNYQEITGDLKNYSAKLKNFHDQKQQIRDATKEIARLKRFAFDVNHLVRFSSCFDAPIEVCRSVAIECKSGQSAIQFLLIWIARAAPSP